MRWLLLLLVWSASAWGQEAAGPLHFEAEIPSCTPPGEVVYLRSNRVDGVTDQHDPLTRIDRTHVQGDVDVLIPLDQLRYKYSLGRCDEQACLGIEKHLEYRGEGWDVEPRRYLGQPDRVLVWRSMVRDLQDELRAPEGQVAFCGPYLSVSEEDGTLTLSHDTLNAGELTLEWGETPAYGRRQVSAGRHRNRFVLGDLAPDTVYHYRFTEDGVAGPDQRLRTAPPPGSPLRIGFVGDVQEISPADLERQRALLARVLTFSPHLILSPGDLVNSAYADGYSSFAPPTLGRFSAAFGVFSPLMAEVPWNMAMGNHEEDADYFWEVFARPPSDPPKLDHYTFRYGNVQVFILYTGKTNGYDLPGMLASQTPWLERALAQSADDPRVQWRLAVMHRVPLSEGSHHRTDWQPFLDAWGPLFERYSVDLVLGGHNHNLTVARRGRTHYVTSCFGAWPHALRRDPQPTTAYAESTCAFLALEATPTRLSLTALRPEGGEVAEARTTLCHEDAACECPQGEVGWCDGACHCTPRQCELASDCGRACLAASEPTCEGGRCHCGPLRCQAGGDCSARRCPLGLRATCEAGVCDCAPKPCELPESCASLCPPGGAPICQDGACQCAVIPCFNTEPCAAVGCPFDETPACLSGRCGCHPLGCVDDDACALERCDQGAAPVCIDGACVCARPDRLTDGTVDAQPGAPWPDLKPAAPEDSAPEGCQLAHRGAPPWLLGVLLWGGLRALRRRGRRTPQSAA